MNDLRREQRRTLVCEAAAALVLDGELDCLTLSDVARAGDLTLSEVTELYPDLIALFSDMVEFMYGSLLQQIGELQGDDERPGSWSRAYLAASFPEVGAENFPRLAAAMLASAAYQPHLINVIRDAQAEIHEAMLNDGLNADVVCVVRAAAEGLWMGQMFQIDFVPAERFQTTLQYLYTLIDSAVIETRVAS